MVIYIDSLIFTNIIIDYFLLNLTSLITKNTYSLKRMVIASLIGGIASLYIFVDLHFAFDILFQLIMSFIIIGVALGIKNPKNLILSLAVFMSVSCLISGAVSFLNRFLENELLITDNMVYYLNISPVSLILITVSVYFIIWLIMRMQRKRKGTEPATLEISVKGNICRLNALIDTGNTACDPFSNSPVFIVDENIFKELSAAFDSKESDIRKRVIPVSTIGENLLLEGIRCDTALIEKQDKKYKYQNPIIASSKSQIKGNYEAIIPYTAIDRITE